MNSTLWALFLETYGSGSLGEGALVFNTDDFRKISIPDISLSKKAIASIRLSLFTREISNIFTELGFNRALPIREQEPNPLPDRKALDDLIFDALELTTDERREVYWAVGELVKHRLDKAASR